MSEGKAVAVIMAGGPGKDANFRPLSLYVAQPLFPLAGKPMIQHQIEACKKIRNLSHVFVIGIYEEKSFALYVASLSNDLRVPVRYLQEDKLHGSAGALHHFRNVILEDSPEYVFVLNCDVVSSFPFLDMLEAQKRTGGLGTMLVKKVSPDSAGDYGELFADPETTELLHYAEKPETFVSDKVNCGLYIFAPGFFDAIAEIANARSRGPGMAPVDIQQPARPLPAGFVRLDQDLFSPLAGKKKLYTCETSGLWEHVRSPATALRCNTMILAEYAATQAHLLAHSPAEVVGHVFIHPSAKVNASAKIGPNVAICSNARIGPGVRLSNCIVLDEVEVKEHAIVSHSIIGWKSIIGRWSRIQATGDVSSKLGVTILGEDVTVEDEVVLLNCIILPHKSLATSRRDEIIL